MWPPLARSNPVARKSSEDEANPSRITCTGSSNVGDKGNYAVTSKIHGMKVGPLDLEIYANYGFDSKAIESEDRLKASAGRRGAQPH